MKRVFNNSRNAYKLYRQRHSIRKMLGDIVRGTYKPSLRTVLIVIGGLLYTISPIDFMPDFIPLIGWLDDGAILYMVMKQLRKETERYSLQQKMQDSRKNLAY